MSFLTLVFNGRARFAMRRVHILLATLGLAACVSTGVDVKQEQLSHFMIGFSTLDDITGQLGNPTWRAS
ncbi:hypothetical protein SB763_32185, partial [Burkholderia sp. SIMBA_042]